MKYICIPILLSIISCAPSKIEEVFTVQQHAVDSFHVMNLMSTTEMFNIAKLNDSELAGFSNNTQFLCRYKKQGRDYIRSDSFFIPNSFHFLAFFIDSNKELNLIGRDSEYAVNKWYRYDFQQRKMEFQYLLNVNLPVLKQYRIFHLQNQPVIATDNSFILDIAAIDPFVFEQSLKEKVYLRVFMNTDTIAYSEQFLDKPSALAGQILPHNVYCRFGSKVLTVFPCMDTIYSYDLDTRMRECIPIHNPNFTPPLVYDHRRWKEADYNTEIRIHSFYYEGIFYNAHTKHLVLFYYTPADETNQVPTYADKNFYALVLDTNYTFVKNVQFTDEFDYAGKFFNTQQGIYMPLFDKKVRDEKKCTYYLFDL